MGDTIFLQFYNQIKNSYYDLCNGFSDTYDLCRGKGDFFWTEHEVDSSKWYSEQIYNGRKLPISRGTVYISAVYLNHLYQSYVWAKEYPDIQFVVGGPVAAEQCVGKDGWNPVYFKLASDVMLPPNLKITGKSVEDWFGVSNFSGRWKLGVPRAVPADNPIYFSYTLDNGCYWRKCIYCNIALHAVDLFRKRKNIGFEFKDVDHKGTRLVRLNTGSMTPAYIRKLLPELPRGDDLQYRMFMRPATPENEALKEVLEKWQGEFPNLMLGLGIEFPSNRMLKYVGKGFEKEEMLTSLRICDKYDIRVNGNFMLGWNNLIEDDLRELEDFLVQIPEGSILNMQVRWLFGHPYTEIHDSYQGEEIKLGPFYVGFRTEINPTQIDLNKRAGEIVEKYGQIKHFKLEGMASIKSVFSTSKG